jgi:hypothetical protein
LALQLWVGIGERIAAERPKSRCNLVPPAPRSSAGEAIREVRVIALPRDEAA